MRSTQAKVLFGLFIAVIPLLFMAACGGSGSDGSSPSSRSSSGTVSVAITDNPIGYNAVVLTVTEVGIVATDIETTYYNSSDLGDLPTTIDVLDYPGEQTFHLADIDIELPENGDPVCFNQVRLVLAEEGDLSCGGEPCNYVVKEGDPTKYVMKTPSGQQSGVKVLTPSDFCIEEGNNTAQVTIDFDPARAIVHNPKNPKDKYILKPTGIRVIEGSWSTEPVSFIDGLVAVPTYNSGTVCEEIDPAPEVMVSAFEQGTLVDPVSQTLSTTEGPVTGAEICTAWCAEDVDPTACEAACVTGLLSECYYSGNFKLLLYDLGTYDVTASWEGFSTGMAAVAYNSTVLLELTSE